MTDNTISTVEAAEQLGVDLGTVQSWITEGLYGRVLPTDPFDSNRVDKADLDEFVLHQEQVEKRIAKACDAHDRLLAKRMRAANKPIASNATTNSESVATESIIVYEVAPIPGLTEPIVREDGSLNYKRGNLVWDPQTGGKIWVFA